MNKERPRQLAAALDSKRSDNPLLSRCVRLGLVSTLGAALALCQTDVPVAQQRQREPGVKVKQIAASGSVVSITADGSLNRAQTWQDGEGFHVVVLNGATDLAAGSPRGVKVRRVGNSLEMVVPVKPGASVTVQPKGNRLDLVVNGEGFADAAESDAREERAAQQAAQRREQREAREQRTPHGDSSAAAPKRRVLSETPAQEMPQPPRRETQGTDLSAMAGAAPQPGTPQVNSQPVAAGSGGEAPPPQAESPSAQDASAQKPDVPAPSAQLRADEETRLGSILFSLPSLLVLLGVSALGAVLFLFRRRRRAESEDAAEPESVTGAKPKVSASKTEEAQAAFEQAKGDRRKSSISVPFDRRKHGRGADDEATRQQALSGSNNSEGGESRGSNPAMPAVLFGSYRIDQEIVKLVQGEPHSIEVLSSRAVDDRRAVETSLLKALRAPETSEDGRRRARTALEDYGFVARESAALLLSHESFERATAARTLGEMKSSQALPFLTEALYDGDAVVRTEVVQSLGSLGLPSAIGALLDIARRHPELPATVLGPALTACSVESLELQWDSSDESRTFAEAGAGEEFFTGEIRSLEPVAEVEQLPEWLEDERLLHALDCMERGDAEVRVIAAQTLAQFQVRRAVEALTLMAMRDDECAVRAAAVTSLAMINHESVFVPVLVAMADDGREVRAAAARALSRLSFDRADAYVRVIENSDAATLSEVAGACVKSGLAAQAINRLASDDRRQAYEAFSLLSLAVKAGETRPILDAVECHRDIEVRLAAIRLLGMMYQPELARQLQRIGENGGVPEKVRLAIRETVERSAETNHVASE
ncbi:MAG TPA: HEAT repeat domain-containing protein [Pyrinomonadaceae bacterium]|nr:HEAT repeat domain-containing protein [Pyrinomonadaceae bacterium]